MRSILAAAILCLPVSHATADTITVCQSGCQYTSINAAIEAAEDHDVIQLGSEVYFEGAVINTLGKPIKIKGETDSEGNPTSIIDGGGSHRVIRCVSGESRSTIFQNLVIRNGFNPNFGAGMYIRGSRPSVQNCLFHANSTPGSGGGLYISDNANPRITGSKFTLNASTASSGEGFIGGGAICIIESNPILDECEISGGVAPFGAGIRIDGKGSSRQTLITSCTIHSNVSAFLGGGLFAAACDVIMKDTQVTANAASKGAGGVQLLAAGLFKMTGCRISGNGGVFAGAGIINVGGPGSLQIKGTVVCGNLTATGGTSEQIAPPNDYTDLGDVCVEADCSSCTSTDTDGDGVPDSEDGCPFDIDKTEPGNCGCGVAESGVFGDVDCDGDYDEDDVRAGIAYFGLATGDVDFDRDYDVDDVMIGVGYFEIDLGGGCPGDLNGDGAIDGADVGLLVSLWGPCIP